MSASQHDPSPEFARAMGAVARELLGEPNARMSNAAELRFGTHGSMSVRLDTGTWCDHEAGGIGGGVLDLVQQRAGLDKPGAVAWLRERGHLDEPAGNPLQKRRQVASYPYRDEHGALLFEVVRFEPKDFRQRRPDGDGWTWKLGNVRRVLFRLPEIIEAVAAKRTVYIVEGEKAALALVAAGLDATCSPGGAGKWRPDYGEPLAGADVAILGDNDDPGRDHAAKVAAALQGIAARVRLPELPGLPMKGDVADWLAAGGTWQRLEELAEDTAALESVTPPSAADPATSLRATWSDQLDWAEDVIPARPWIAVGYLLRAAVTVLIGPGGASKSTLMIAYAVSLALGIECNGMRPLGQFRVALFNAEDDGNEQRRRLSAVLTSLGKRPADVADRILRIGPEKVATLLCRHPDSGVLLPTRAMEEMEAELIAFRPDVLILDPLAELHGEDENANVALREVVAEFRALAKRHNLSLVLVHHTRKGPVIPGDMDAGRGASAIASAARIVLTVVGMQPDEEKALGLPSGARKHYFRLDGGKSNYHTLTDCEWFERQSYTLANGDQVAVPKPWTPLADVVSLDTRLAIHDAVAAGSSAGPWSVKLSSDPRSIKTVLIANGVNTTAGQKAAVDTLLADGFVVANFRRANRAKAQGLRSPDGMPHNADWMPDDGT